MATFARKLAARCSPLLSTIAGSQGRRWGWYIIWLGLANAVPLATDRLLILPHVNSVLGKSVFATFLFIQTFYFITGNIVANGLSLVLLREYVNQPDAQAPRMLRTAMLLAAIACLITLPLTTLLAFTVSPEVARGAGLPLFLCLPLVAAFRSMDLVLLNMLRIKRAFGFFAGLKIVDAIILMSCLRPLDNFSLWEVAIAYTLSSGLTFLLNVAIHRRLLVGGGWYDKRYVRLLLGGSAAGALMTLFDQSQVHLSKLILGLAIDDIRAIAVFFAATSVGNLFVMPMHMVSACVLSLLAARRDFVLQGHRFLWFVACGMGSVVCMGGTSYLLGPHLVKLLYPEMAQEAAAFFAWIVIASGGSSFVMLMRPIVVKYGRLSTATWLAAGTVIAQVVALPFAASAFGIYGAAVVLALVGTAAAGVWLAITARIAQSATAETDTDTPLQRGKMAA